MSNKSNGTEFEKEFAQILSDNGFWAHCIRDNQNGQPFDVIAAKNGETLVFDCKDCKNETFNLSRMEENQRNAMELWMQCGNSEGVFAVRYPDGTIYLFPIIGLIKAESKGIRSISRSYAKYYGVKLERFMKSESL